ncbi:ATP-binding cassette domain-containing protein [Corynebacterium sp. AOP40-9SA-29]|uniref:ATP-binding cassette domain-containing protein n=1 Tax=Corynebacterium sp. AOP40-9SA-29 TaxID=3457677 RepID=UPI0040339A77
MTTTLAPPATGRTTAGRIGTVLDLGGLSVSYDGVPAVRDVDLSVAAGETVALVGESGSGKSTMARAAVGLLGRGATVTVEDHRILGTDLSGRVPPDRWRRLYRDSIGYIPQDAGDGLNPVRSVGSQLAEALATRGTGRRQVREALQAALQDVGLDADVHAGRYPHELSGGQRQRVLIALALIGDPSLVIADEPTSALDVTVQKQVLDLLECRVRESGAALLLITHDLGVAYGRADRTVVLQGGRIVEQGPTTTVLSRPQQAYTRELVSAVPGKRAREPRRGGDPVVTATGLSRRFRKDAPPAVDGVDLTVRRGTTLGIVGESGSGKTTTARILLGLEPFDAGEATVLGRRIGVRKSAKNDAVVLSRQARLVHQDPTGALDPGFTVAESVAEPLEGFRIGDRASRRARVAELLDLVALPSDAATRRPAELSGGQRQRVAIARALAVEPELLVLDEPVSALDVSVQARILDLLTGLQEQLGLTYLFISHDLGVVRDIADEVVVMASGRVVEHGPAARVLRRPESDLTARLLAAVPTLPALPAQNGAHHD